MKRFWTSEEFFIVAEYLRDVSAIVGIHLHDERTSHEWIIQTDGTEDPETLREELEFIGIDRFDLNPSDFSEYHALFMALSWVRQRPVSDAEARWVKCARAYGRAFKRDFPETDACISGKSLDMCLTVVCKDPIAMRPRVRKWVTADKNPIQRITQIRVTSDTREKLRKGLWF